MGERFKFPPGSQGSQAEEYAKHRKKKVGFADKKEVFTVPRGREHRYTGGGLVDVDPSEKQGYIKYGHMLGSRDQALKERRRTEQRIRDIRKQNENFVAALRKRGGEQIDARDRQIKQMMHAGGKLAEEMGVMDARLRAGGRQLSQRDARIRAGRSASTSCCRRDGRSKNCTRRA